MNNKLYKLMNWPKIEGIVYSEEDNPHELLGPHVVGSNTLFQFFMPGITEASIIFDAEPAKPYKMELADEIGYFACLVPGKETKSYQYQITDSEGNKRLVQDPYRFKPQLTSKDLEKLNAGIHYTSYEKLGAHIMTIDGVTGTSFAVWAPNAIRVSTVGDFNHWDGRVHQMRRLGDSGIFEIFIPGVTQGMTYKYELKVRGGLVYMKADPYAFAQELRPDTASIVSDINSFAWEDKQWLINRKKKQRKNSPISVYELYLGSFLKKEDDYVNYKELAPEIITYVKEMGYTHIELMPIMEHPLDQSWGYQVIGYYAPTARYGTPEDFVFFMNEMHKAGIGVILDWVPAHFPKDNYGLSNFDGTCLYEHLDPRKGTNPQWGTLLYNYGRPQVSNYLLANALFWIEQYHADGIRMDAVASMLYLDYGKKDGEWVANMYGGNENLEAVEFLKHLNSIMKKRNPDILMIAEESTAWPNITASVEEDGLGFDMKWNMGWMNDYLHYISFDPYFRAHHHHELTFSMIYAYSENFMLVLSHDEVVHGKSSMIGKMPGERQDKFANLRLTYAYMFTHPGKKLLFMGQDLAQFNEFNEAKQTEWELLSYEEHKKLNHLVKALNELYTVTPALYELDNSNEGFEWINCINAEHCLLAFMRKTAKTEDSIVVVVNFANVTQDFSIGVPYEGKYIEILNTDAKCYGGEGRINRTEKSTVAKECDARPYSFKMSSAPLSVSIFKYQPYSKAELALIAEKKAAKEEAAAKKRAEKAKAELEKRMQERKKAEAAIKKMNHKK